MKRLNIASFESSFLETIYGGVFMSGNCQSKFLCYLLCYLTPLSPAFSIIPVPYSIEHSPLRCDGGERGAWEGLHLQKNNRFVTFSLLSVCSHLYF